MNNIPKNEVSVKEFKKLLDQVKKMDKKYAAQGKDLATQVNMLDKASGSKIKTQNFAFDKKIANMGIEIDNKMKQNANNNEKQFNILNHNSETLRSENGLLRREIQLIQRNVQEHIKTQEEIIMEMIHKFHDENMRQNQVFTLKLEDIRNELDVMKISFTLSDKQLIGKLSKLIRDELSDVLREREKEVLMKMWISELRGIIKDFDKLKKTRSKEFNIRINEIADTIELFKEKLAQ